MGSFTLTVEATARDVNALLTLHRVHPQVRSDVQRLLQHLVKKSYEHMASLQPGYEEAPDQICRAIATDLVERVVNIAVPASQLSLEEAQSARYYQELQEARHERDAVAERERAAELALADLKQAHDYMLHSYFHEVLILRQRISDLQLQQKKSASVGTSGLSTGNSLIATAGYNGGHRISYPSMRSVSGRLSSSTAAAVSPGNGGANAESGPQTTRGDLVRSSSFSSLPTPTPTPPAPVSEGDAAASAAESYRLGDALRHVASPRPLSTTARGAGLPPPSASVSHTHTSMSTRLPSEVTSRATVAKNSKGSDNADNRGESAADTVRVTAFFQTAKARDGTGFPSAPAEMSASPGGPLSADRADATLSYAVFPSPFTGTTPSSRGGHQTGSVPTPPHTQAPTTHTPAEKEQMQMLFAISHPTESVDAVFDYERYVSLLNGPHGSWDARYVELLVAKEEAEARVTKERSRLRVGFQFARAERRDRLERVEHEVQMEQARNNKWWWAQKLAVEEVQRDYAERIAAIREDMEALRSTMMHDYLFNLNHAMSLLQSRIDVLLNFFLVYIKATDETVRAIQRDARARTRADLLITDHHSQHSSTAVKAFFENPDNERERPNIAAELVRLQDDFWHAERTKGAELKEIHPLSLLKDAVAAASVRVTGSTRTADSAEPAAAKSDAGKAVTQAFRAKAAEATHAVKDPKVSGASPPPGEDAATSSPLGEPLRSTVSSTPKETTAAKKTKKTGQTATPEESLGDRGGDDNNTAEGRASSPSPTPATYRTDGLPYWERHPITKSAQKVFGELQKLARKLRLRKAVQLENEIRITSTRGRQGQVLWHERRHRSKTGGSAETQDGGWPKKRTDATGSDVDGETGDDAHGAVATALAESAGWAMQDGWEDMPVSGDAQGRTARDILRELVRLRQHRIVNTVRRRTTLRKLQAMLDVLGSTRDTALYANVPQSKRDRLTSTGTAGRRSEASTRGRDSTVSLGTRMSHSGASTRTKENLLSLDYLRDDSTTWQDLDSNEELDVRIAMLAKVCEVAEDRIQSDTLAINALLRLLRNHKVATRDWEKERVETDEEYAARLAREKAEHEAHLARLLASPYWKAPPQKFYPQGAATVAFLPAGLIGARQRPMASHVVFQGETLPINAFLQQRQPGDKGGADASTSTTPSLASRIVTRGQKRTPYAAVMDYCQGVQMGLPMSDRRGPVYLQYDASQDAYYVADDEGTDLVAEGQRRLTQFYNSVDGDGDSSPNNIFNGSDAQTHQDGDGAGNDGALTSAQHVAFAQGGGRTLYRSTVPMTQVLFPAPDRTFNEAPSPAEAPGTTREGAYVYITNPEDDGQDGVEQDINGVRYAAHAGTVLAPMYLVPLTIPVEDVERTLYGGARTRTSTLYATTTADPSWAATSPTRAPFHLLDAGPSSAPVESIWRTLLTQAQPSHPHPSPSGLPSARRTENAYYHNPPTVCRPPTEEQRMLAVAGYRLVIPTPQPAHQPSLVAPSESEGDIHYDGEGKNYTALFPAGSTFFSTSSPIPAVSAPSHTTPTTSATSIMQDPLSAAATSIAKTRQLRAQRLEESRQAEADAQRQRRQEWHDRVRTQEPTERERFLRLRLPHLAPIQSDSIGIDAPLPEQTPVPSTTLTSPPPQAAVVSDLPRAATSLSMSRSASGAPSPMDAVRLQQQLRASHGKAITSAAGLSARDTVDKRTLISTSGPAAALTMSTMPSTHSTQPTDAVTTTGALAEQPLSPAPPLPPPPPLRLPPEFVQVTQPRTTTAVATSTVSRTAGHGAGRQSRKLDGTRFT